MRLLIGVSGSIAAYKALELARLAIRAGHSVRVVQTEASTRFVGAAAFTAITGAPVLIGEFDDDPERGRFPGEPLPERSPISHLALVERADVYLIAPASANTIAKLASGQADNLLTTAALAARCPVAVAPAMNERMYAHPATQANLRTLRDRGVAVIAPAIGELASYGEHGAGRLPEPAALLAVCERLAGGASGASADAETVAMPETSSVADAGTSAAAVPSAVATNADPGPSPQAQAGEPWSPAESLIPAGAGGGDLAALRVLVTAGGTQEPIDTVRYIGNRSSGRMGYALAEVAAARGADVTVIAANVSLPAPVGVKVVPVRTAAELADSCAAAFDDCDILLMAAAVADFRPAQVIDHKLKKDSDEAPRRLKLKATKDVLAKLSTRRHTGQLLIGFAAEHGGDPIAYGRSKLIGKDLDAIVVNDVSQPGIGFESRQNEVTILTRDGGVLEVPRADKRIIAEAILDAVRGLYALTAFAR
jgi:phosphopantothenoylcysteine decarboxylase/phosphopantothenate--cysteine ligase